MAETKTFAPMLKRCLARYPIKRVIVVADRGVLSYDNLATLERLDLATGEEAPEGTAPKLPLQYILAVPARRYGELYEAVQPLAFDTSSESIRETNFADRRLVIAHHPEAAKAQQAARRAPIDTILALGEKLAKRLDDQDKGRRLKGRRASDRAAYVRFQRAITEAELHRFVRADFKADLFSFAERDAEIEKAERLDGKLMLVTNVSELKPEEVVARYKALADIERGFRVLKSDLDIAPVYHRLPERIRAHELICFLALLMHRVMRQRLKAAGRSESVERALRELKKIQHHQVKFGTDTLTAIGRAEPAQSDLFQALGAKSPPQTPP